jgi:hypothetical protein
MSTQMSAPDSGMHDVIVQNLLNMAASYAQSRGYGFEAACWADLTTFFSRSVAGASGPALAAFENDPPVHTLVDAMIEEVASHSPGDTMLHEWGLSGALSRICPLFPFC